MDTRDLLALFLGLAELPKLPRLPADMRWYALDALDAATPPSAART